MTPPSDFPLEVPDLEKSLEEPLKAVDKVTSIFERLGKVAKRIDSEFTKVDNRLGFPTRTPIETPPAAQELVQQRQPASEADINHEIAELQKITDDAEKAINAGNFEAAVEKIKEAAKRTSCGVCVDKYARFGLDTRYAEAVCDLGRGGEDCEKVKEDLQKEVQVYREEKIPKYTRIHHDRFTKGEVDHATGRPTPRKSKEAERVE